jgi:hypothetical protein
MDWFQRSKERIQWRAVVTVIKGWEPQIMLPSNSVSFHMILRRCRDSSVGTATGYELVCRVQFFFPPQRPERLWGPPSLLSNGYRGLIPGGEAAWA